MIVLYCIKEQSSIEWFPQIHFYWAYMKGPVIFFSLRFFFSQGIHLNHFLQLKQWIKLAGQCKSVWLGCRKENIFGPQCKVLYGLFNTPQSALLCFDKPQSALWSLWLKTNDHEALWVSNIMPQSACYLVFSKLYTVIMTNEYANDCHKNSL